MSGPNLQQAPRYTGVQTQTSSSSLPIGLFYGQTRGALNFIWAANFQYHGAGLFGKGGAFGKAPSGTYTADVAMALCEGPIAGIGTCWVNNGQTESFGDLGLTLFSGTDPQSPWGYLSSNYPDQALSYANTCYVAAAGYNLGTSASVPAISFEIKGLLHGTQVGGSGDADPAELIYDFLTDVTHGCLFPVAALDLASLNSSAYATTTGDSAYQTYCRAMGWGLSVALASQESGATAVARWLQITNTAPVWTGYCLRFVPWGDEDVTGHGVNYLARDTTPSFVFDDSSYVQNKDEDPIVLTIADWFDAFNAVAVECRDRSNNYNNAPIDWRDQTAVELFGRRYASVVQAHEINVTAQATQVAALIGQRMVYIRRSWEFTVDERFSRAEPMDFVELNDARAGLVAQLAVIIDMEEQDDGTLKFTAQEWPGTTGSPNTVEQSGASPVVINSLVAPAPVNAPIIVEPSSSLTHGVAQVWVALSGGAAGVADKYWGGAIVNVSTDGSSYTAIGRVNAPARMGSLTAALPAYGGANPDTTHTLSVSLAESGGTLISATSGADAAAMSTVCYVDGELISFTVATLTGANAYNLTGLYRGQGGTTPGAHASGTQFTRVDDAVFTYDLPAAYIGQTLYFKFQSVNIWGNATQDISTCAVYTYAPVGTGYGSGAGGTPAAPTGGSAAGTSSSIVTVNWAANAPSDNVTTYRLFRATGSGQPFSAASLIWSGVATTYVDNGRPPGAAFTYFVEAVNVIGASAPSAAINGTTGSNSYTDGEILIGDTATGNLVAATLTAGANVTIANGPGSVTISASGGGGGGGNWIPLSLGTEPPILVTDSDGVLILVAVEE